MTTAVVAFAGVLRSSGALPIPEGVRLYRALVDGGYRVVIAVDNGASFEVVEHFLRIEGLRGHSEILGNVPAAGRGGDQRVEQVQHLVASGQRVSLVVDANPDTCAELLRLGHTSALFVSPKFGRPEFRPDYKEQIRPWDEIVKELEHQAFLETQESPPE